MLCRNLSRRFAPILLIFSLLLSTLALGGCYKGEVDRLRQELEVAKEERENLKKQIELLSNTVKQLADLNALNQSVTQKKEDLDQTVKQDK